MIEINTLKTKNNGYIKISLDKAGCIIESGSVRAGALLYGDRTYLDYGELKSLHNIIETALYGLEGNDTACTHIKEKDSHEDEGIS